MRTSRAAATAGTRCLLPGLVIGLLLCLLATGCSDPGSSGPSNRPEPSRSSDPRSSDPRSSDPRSPDPSRPSVGTGGSAAGPSRSATPATARPDSPAGSAGVAPARTARHRQPDPRNRFYTTDRTAYRSPWYAGRHRIMVPYGCTRAPYYSPDPRCRARRGFHHGIDIALPCATPILAGVAGRAVDPNSSGRPGPAYGRTAFRIRTSSAKDVLIGHARRVYVRPGDRVRRGERIALAGARGAPDGCHLHLEVRSAGGGLSSARNPSKVARLRD